MSREQEWFSKFAWAAILLISTPDLGHADLASLFFSTPTPPLKYETNIPIVSFEKIDGNYAFDMYLKGHVPDSASPTVKFNFYYFDKTHNDFFASPEDTERAEFTPADYKVNFLNGAGPRSLNDVGGKQTLVDGELTHIHFTLPESTFKKSLEDPNLTSGSVRIAFADEKSGTYARVFHVYSEKLKRSTPAQTSDKTSLHVPVLIFADYIGQKNPQEYADSLKKTFDRIWSQCHIEIKITGMAYFPVANRMQAQHVVDLSPEYFYAMRTLREDFPAYEQEGDVVALNWRAGNPLSGDSKRDGFRQVGGITMNFADGNFVTNSFKSELAKNAPKKMVMFDDEKTLAHEIGHVLLGLGHDRWSSNLMSKSGEGMGATGENLTSSQCATAQQYIEKHYPQQETIRLDVDEDKVAR